jgi:SAM-dependent methyltransferase
MDTPHRPYIHGRSDSESERLEYQSAQFRTLFHHDTRYPKGSRVLEAGCGVGAQTGILAQNSPEARFVSVDISAESLEKAKKRLSEAGTANVTFRQADVYHLPFGAESFDHVFVCFLLEHLSDPVLALKQLRSVLCTGGTITVIEGDHGSTFFHPDSTDARAVIGCLIEIQKQLGGNALIGRELWHLLDAAGFARITVSPRSVYADGGRPESMEGVKKIFIAMIESIREEALSRGLIDETSWERGLADLYRTAEPGGSFCYTFFKATGYK